MTEINSNISNFGINTGKIEPKKEKEKEKIKQENENNDIKQQPAYVQDTGVLGRSQIVKTRGSDVSKSVDEAVALAQTHPELLAGADIIFENAYNDFIKQGMSENDAYINASHAQVEFMDIAAQRYQL